MLSKFSEVFAVYLGSRNSDVWEPASLLKRRPHFETGLVDGGKPDTTLELAANRAIIRPILPKT